MGKMTDLATAYDDDFVLWLEAQSALLRDGRLEQLDVTNLLAELEALVRNHRRELRSRLKVIILHLLKWQCQPRLRWAGWRAILRTQRDELELLLDDCPSLVGKVAPFAAEMYARAVRTAVHESGLPAATFPAQLPYTATQLLDLDFLPQAL